MFFFFFIPGSVLILCLLIALLVYLLNHFFHLNLNRQEFLTILGAAYLIGLVIWLVRVFSRIL